MKAIKATAWTSDACQAAYRLALLALSSAIGFAALVLPGCSTGSGPDGPQNVPGDLTVSPRDPWLLSMVQGSMPTPSDREFQLTNTGASPLDWTVLSTEPWVELSTTGGQLAGAGTTTVTASLVPAVVNTFAPNTYRAEIEFQDITTPNASPVVVQVLLAVTTAQLSISVTPEIGLNSSGNQGGPFTPESKVYTITNTGTLPFDWEVTTSTPWILILPVPAGTLAPGDSTQVEVFIDQSKAAKLASGQHAGQVLFSEQGSGAPNAVRDVRLDVKTGSQPSGWIQFTPSSDTRMVYVSSSQGNDANDGLSQASPKKSLGAGISLLRDGYPDWLLLRKGDTWNDGLGNWSLSGRGVNEPMLVSSYGSGNRPRLNVGHNSLVGVYGNFQYLAFVDLHAVCAPHGSSVFARPLDVTSGGHILMEGCLAEGFDNAPVLQYCHDIAIRRNVFVDSLGGAGLFTHKVANVLIEENVIDNGHLLFNGSTLPDHGMYLDSEQSSGLVVRGNIVSRHPSHGIQCRPGGQVTDNLVVETAIALLLGNSENSTPNGVDGDLSRNVALHGRNIPAGYGPRGWGIYLENINSATISDNIVAHLSVAGHAPRPITLDGRFRKIHNAHLTGNVVYNWGVQGGYASIFIQGNAGPSGFAGLRLESNDLQNSLDGQPFILFDSASVPSVTTSGSNEFFVSFPSNQWFIIGGKIYDLAGYKAALNDQTSTSSTNTSYPAADNATIPGYMASLGQAATMQAFYAEIRKQSKDNWRPEFTAPVINDWVRAAFGLDPL